MLAWTGDIDRVSDEGDVVYLIDPDYPSQASYVQDPAPEKDKRFAVNALLQGNKLIVISRFKKGGGVVDIINTSSRQRIKTFVQRGGHPSFGASLASDGTYFAVGSPGLEAGKPAGSQVEVYRWSDFKRVFRKTSNKNSRFGEDVVLREGVLHVTTGPRSKVASFSLPKGKPVVAPLPALEGAALNGEGQYLLLSGQALRAFSAEGVLSWSVPNPLWNTESRARCSVSEGLVVFHHRDEVHVLSEEDGSLLARVKVPYYWSSSIVPITAAAVVEGRLFILQGSSVRVVPLENAGDYQAWQHFRSSGDSAAEFNAYVASRIASGSPFASVVSGAQGIAVDSTGTHPPDVLVLVEIEIRPGVWRAVVWREGHGPWTTAAGSHIGNSLTVPWPHGTNESSAVRVRYAPLSPHEEWSEGTILTPWIDLPLPSQVSGLIAEADLDGDGIPAAIEAKLGSDPSEWDASPLRLETVDGVMRVSHLRPQGDATVHLESSEDFKEWGPATQDESLRIEVEAENDQFERVTAIPLSTGGRKYFRLSFSS
ncbi:MAG: hypothetical protein EOP87_13595 [Verrucomicrobiaceae bacterium]|nr:MAG: hypothetical protein EOP87_13595 [Verrucomicrobiaceae bacterium]